MLAGFLPVERRQLVDLFIGRGGQALQNVFQIGDRFDPVHSAVFNQRIHDSAAFTGFFRAEEEPILFSECGGPDRVFDLVV